MNHKEAVLATAPAAFQGDYGSFKHAIIGQETGGRYGVPNAQGSGALGVGQQMPDTARVLAGRLGLPYRPDLLAGNSPEARQYQDQITEAASQEAWQAGGGDPRKAAMYYHGGSNQAGWGPKTHSYADEVVGRMKRRTDPRTVANPDRSQWDKRADGSEKGDGWLGVMRRPDGKVSSEISAGVDPEELGLTREQAAAKHLLNEDGYIDIPTMVPGLTKPELDYLMTHEPDLKKNPRFFEEMPRSIMQKAADFARRRIAAGKSQFRQRGEAMGAN